MIINENLLLGYGNHNNTAELAAHTTSAVAPVKKGQKYTISYTVTNTNRFAVYFDTLSNGWKSNYDTITVDQLSNVTQPGDKIEKTVAADMGGYMIIYLANNGGDFKEVDLKIEEGDKKTPYIPSKNMLDPSEQAIFVAGGGIPGGLSKIGQKGVLYVN